MMCRLKRILLFSAPTLLQPISLNVDLAFLGLIFSTKEITNGLVRVFFDILVSWKTTLLVANRAVTFISRNYQL